jgi:DNA helicase IV
MPQWWWTLPSQSHLLYQLDNSATLPPVYQLQGAGPWRSNGLKFISPSRARRRIEALLAEYRYAEADELFTQSWFSYTRARYAALRLRYWELHRAQVGAQLAVWLGEHAFAKADALAARSTVVVTPQEYAQRKRPHVIHYFNKLGHRLSDEQAAALVAPAQHLLVKARAGSGKTLTIAAKAALLIEQEQLDPDQVLLLAFNKKAAAELQARMQEKFGYPGFRTAITFHSLAYRLVEPQEEIPSSDEEKNQLVEEAMRAAWTPRLRWLMDRFFEATDDPEISAEAEMDATTHLAHRLEHVNHLSISGKAVKSKGEKWIADLLFSHDIRFTYEQVFTWDGGNYRPDFTIRSSVAPYTNLAIIEHWGVGAATPGHAKPFGDEMTAAMYRKQMAEKRIYWRAKGVPLIETSVDDMRQGRAVFNAMLLAKLKAYGIEAVPLDEATLAERVQKRYWNELTQRMGQFIQRAKNRRKSPADIKRMLLDLRTPGSHETGLRTRIFWRLAARVYVEYEKHLAENGQMDFQDLLARAGEKIEEAKGNLSFVPKMAAPQAGDKPVNLARLRWLLIDEYQDFNPGFDHLITTLRRYNPDLRLFCVGDDWQAINSFAGSEPIFFRDFVSRFGRGQAAEMLLRTNYRSYRAIVEVGNELMKGTGTSSRANFTEEGNVYVTEVDRLWLATLPTSTSVEDGITDGHGSGTKNKFDNGFMGAKCLEICVRLSLPALQEGKSVAILNRTNWIHDDLLTEFRTKLIGLLGSNWQKKFEPSLQVTTMHKYKGLQAELVILPDITQRRMPLLHQDTRLYAPFLPPGTDPIEEARTDERRLFYVALTRAKETLWILTESNRWSEFLKDLPVKWVRPAAIPPLPEKIPARSNLPAATIYPAASTRTYRGNTAKRSTYKGS